MLQFDYPWLLLLAPLPLLGYHLLPRYVQGQVSLRTTYAPEIYNALQTGPKMTPPTSGRRWLVSYWLVWLLLLSAAARPVELAPPMVIQVPTRDLILAIDLSQSMDTLDYQQPDGTTTDRLAAVKSVVSDFIRQRKNDRIGLLVFGDRAFIQSPPTRDHDTVIRLLADTATGMAGPSTAIGDAIGLGVRLLDHKNTNDKLMILLTDGNDTASRIVPRQAAEIAARRDIRIHTIAVGDPDAQSDDPVDIESLTAIAETTGGEFFLATDHHALTSVYNTLDQLTPHQARRLSFQPRTDWFWLPVGLALTISLLTLATTLVRYPANPPRAEATDGS